MSRHRRSREQEVDPFYDMLFNMLIAFVFCFIVALLAMNPKALKAGDVPSKAEYLITLSWPDFDPNDIDTWVEAPSGDVVWFRNRDAGLMHLDRDDRGRASNTIEVNGQAIVNPLNQEVVTIRGIVAGEYVVNAHYYQARDAAGKDLKEGGSPVPVTLSVVKVNPRAEVVYYGQHTLQRKGEEFTMVRFTLQPDGGVTGINTLPKKLVEHI
jgi:hypothetical protein